MSKTQNGQQAAAFINASKKKKEPEAILHTEQETTTVKRNYRINMAFDSDLKDFMFNASWEQRKSITQWLNDLVRAEMERGAAAADPEE